MDGVSPLTAGIRLLPLLLSSPLATGLAGYLTNSRKVPPIYLIIIGSILQLIGISLTLTLPLTTAGNTTVYGFEVIIGFGFAFGLSTLLILAPRVVSKADLAVTMGVVTQIRTLGGTLGLAVCSTVLSSSLSGTLPKILKPEEIASIDDSIATIGTLDEGRREAVRLAFAEGYTQQVKALVGFCAVVVVVSALMIEKRGREKPTPAPTEVSSQ